jgi:hypothetical protein
MHRLIAALAVGSLALCATAAEAAKKPKKPAKVYSATLTPTSGSAYGAISGKAQMVDNKKRDTAKVQLKGLLSSGSTYSWTIFRGKPGLGTGPICDPVSAGATVSAFRYKDIKVNPAGNGSATAKSKTFQAVSTTRYGVAVSNADGVIVACGELKRKKAA